MAEDGFRVTLAAVSVTVARMPEIRFFDKSCMGELPRIMWMYGHALAVAKALFRSVNTVSWVDSGCKLTKIV